MTASSQKPPAHADLVHQNAKLNVSKPVVDWAYDRLYDRVLPFLPPDPKLPIVEFGSGHRDLSHRIPNLIRTDIFQGPGITRIENAYDSTFGDHSTAAILATDVFHHLEYPLEALREWRRILAPGGRLVLLEPALSLLGRLVYGPFHAEPIGSSSAIQTGRPPAGFDPDQAPYYAAQGNGTFLFVDERNHEQWNRSWEPIRIERFAALYYVLTGGYTRPQLLPSAILRVLHRHEAIFDRFPSLFATRLLVVLRPLDESTAVRPGSGDRKKELSGA